MNSKSQVIVVKDKNIDLAIAEGLSILEAEKSEVDIEVLDPGKQGFFGIGSRMAKVKLILKYKDETIDDKDKVAGGHETNKNDDSSDIKVVNKNPVNEVISLDNNKIKLKKLHNGKYPVLMGDNNIDFFENGQLIEVPFILTDNNNIEYNVKDISPKNEIIIDVSDDKLKAFLKIDERNGKLFNPKIVPAASDEIDFIILTEVVKEVEPQEITIDDIYWKLDKLNISNGIKIEEIKKAINNPGQKYLIAEGHSAKKGVDGWIEYLYKNKSQQEELEDPMKNIDYFSRNNISSVTKGEIVAIKHPVIEGVK